MYTPYTDAKTGVTMIKVPVYSKIIAIPTPAILASRQAFMGGGTLVGFNVKETSGSALASWDIYDGTNPTGLTIITLSVPAGATLTQTITDYGLPFETGLFINHSSGASLFVLWIRQLVGRMEVPLSEFHRHI